MSSENATVHVSNISHKTTEKEIKDFFSFCGKIETISVTPTSSDPDSTLSATVTFQQPSAARTALLLDNTQLSGNPIHVSSSASLTDLQHNAEQQTADNDEELRQEDKPRAAILAEYLSHGYVIGDKALQRGIELDEKHGFSTKFTNYLKTLEAKFKVADKTRAADSTYGISTRANSGYNTITRYFESALNTPTGQKIRAFYDKGSKQVMDIHTEARRLADLRAESTKCTCGGVDGKCTCPGGKCTCTGCSKAADKSSTGPAPASAPAASSSSEKATYQ